MKKLDLFCACEKNGANRFDARYPLPLFLCLCLVLLGGLTGCGSEDPAGQHELFSVAGTVTLDGKPLAQANVDFIPTGETPGRGGYAVTDQNGDFVVTNHSQKAGLESGQFNVQFSKTTLPDGSPVPEGQSPADLGAINTLPAHLTGEDGIPPATLTVEGAQAGVRFELRSRKR